MGTVQCIGKTVLATIGAAFAALFLANIVLAVGMPPLLALIVVSSGWAVYMYNFSASQWESEKAGLWALAGFLFGIFAFPFLWYSREHYLLTKGQEREAPAFRYTLTSSGEETPVAQRP
jgi:hypothetical protein